MANPEHVEIVQQGAEAIRKWRAANPGVPLELSGAKLGDVNLSDADTSTANFVGADLTGANLRGAKLHRVDFSKADFSRADLRWADLHLSNLSGAKLREANLCEADLRRVNFTTADLSRADFGNVNLNGAVFREATVGYSHFANVDLSEVKGLETVTHIGPSTIGGDTLFQSKGNIPEEFLHGCGLQPWEILAAGLYAPAITPDLVAEIQNAVYQERTKGYSLGGIFISYSHQDSEFVGSLYDLLKAEGANVWLDHHDLVAGPMQEQLSQIIRDNDVVLIVLSESSLESDWVANELDMARSKEKELNRNVLCPVALDDAWKARVADLNANDRHLWRTLTTKNVLDFSGWQIDGFEEPFRKLLDGIKRYYGTAAGRGKTGQVRYW